MNAEYDEHGRGKLQREFHKLCGFDPTTRPEIGFAAFSDAVDLAMRAKSMDFPTRFKPMLSKAVLDILAEVLPAMVKAELDPVRKAFADLKAEIATLKKAGIGSRPVVRVTDSLPVMSNR